MIARSSRIMIVLAVFLCLGSALQAALLPTPVQNAVNRLAAVLDVNPEAIEVVSYELVEWPDSSLGVPRKGYGYLLVITAGYKVILAHHGRQYEYHTDTGNRVVLADAEPDLPIHTGDAPAAGAPVSPSAAPCRADLAKRLNANPKEITVVKVEPATFTDGALGFPRPGMAYTKALVPGYFVTLSYKDSEYIYGASDKACRYGGPVDARQYSALYLEPIPNEPNFNGNLMQVALAGDNPRPVLQEVSDFYPQADGSLLAKRRMSRSGHVLLYLAPKSGEAVQIDGGMDFVDATVNRDGQSWAAIVRPGLGLGWVLRQGLAGQKPQGEPVALPDGRPQRLYWHMDNPVVLVEQEGNQRFFELSEGAFKPISFWPPESEELSLNKSEMLVVKTDVADGKPVTKVVSEWFTGDQTLLGQIPGFTASGYSLTPGKRFMLLWGKSGEQHQSYTVDLRTHEVLETVAEAHGPVKLWVAPPSTPIAMSDAE